MRGGNYLTAVVAVALCTALSGCSTALLKHDETVDARAAIAPREQPAVTLAAPPPGGAAAAAAAHPAVKPGAEVAAPSNDVWARLRQRFDFVGVDNAAIGRAREWYGRHPRHLREVTMRARPYLHYIANEIERRDLPGELALLPILESGYRTDTASPYGAAGLWQFMGGTGTKFGLRMDHWYDGRMDVMRSTDAALNYLAALNERFDGDWLMAIAAYNAGWGNIEKAIANQRRLGRRMDIWSLPVTNETRLLVARLLALADIVAAPEQYGVSLETVPDQPYFDVVELREPTDVRQFGVALGASDFEFAQLNAAWRRGHTGTAGGRIYVPVARLDSARELVASGVARAVPPLQRVATRETGPNAAVSGRSLRVRKGDSLSTIAARHGVTVSQLADANGLKIGRTLHVGQTLRVPVRKLATHGAGRRASGHAQSHVVRYKVRSGDSLWTISRQFKVTVKQLLAWNGLERRQQLQPGQELLVSSES